ncbi:MAG: hypothetical protein J3Q66DRAFT_358520 [Benniella sp.]|nr:MAG: hypothetical protein J3Q66DRAFT_358520 [Benniella sp.]
MHRVFWSFFGTWSISMHAAVEAISVEERQCHNTEGLAHAEKTGHRIRVVLLGENSKDFKETFERERFVGHCRK